MKITPIDIRHKEFKRSLRGFSEEEVDIFLDDVADDFEILFKEKIELQDEVHRLRERVAHYDTLKETLQNTLIGAQQQADTMQANVRKESELILKDAEIKARGILAESYSEKQKVQQSIAQLRQLEDDFRFKFKSLLEAHLNLLLEEENSEGRRKARFIADNEVQSLPDSAVVEDTAPHPGPLLEESEEPPAPALVPTTDSASESESTVASPVAAAFLAEPSADDEQPFEPSPEAEIRSVAEDEEAGKEACEPVHTVAMEPGDDHISSASQSSPRGSQEPDAPDTETDGDGSPDTDGSLESDTDMDSGDGDLGSKDKKESSVRRFFFGPRGEDREPGKGKDHDDRVFDW
ncbi:MAG: DivIVA domain-containing protein [Actinobacteria bacterium]|nr:DivIVA domain-containing protein [Actinomycetota bacterium]